MFSFRGGPMRFSFQDFLRTSISTVMAITMLFAAFEAPLAAQFTDIVRADPNMPVKDGFDTDRAIFWARPNFTPLRDPQWQSLQGARRAGKVGDRTTVVTFDVGGRTLVLVSSEMAYHHVAQGEMEGEPWMVTF